MKIDDAHRLFEVQLNFPSYFLGSSELICICVAFHVDRLPQPEPFKRIGNLLSCGQNEVGQLGFDDDVIEKTRPALVVNGETAKVVDISAGGMHSK